MKRFTYHNRYGDDIMFEQTTPTTITMSGFEHYRFGEDFIDPSGGPFIKVGMDVGRYFHDNIERRVKSIEVIEGKITLLV